jgi:histone H3/H4
LFQSELVLKEIRRYQKSCDLLLLKLSFERLMKEIFQNMKKSHFRIQFIALFVLQKAAEATIVTNFADEHAQILMMLFTDFINDELVRYSREKNDDADKEF